jgi:hypothetical protein
MSDIRGVNNSTVPPPSQGVDQPAGKVPNAGPQPAQPDIPTGPPGPLGQPTGMPPPVVPGQSRILPDVVAGRDPSQLKAAEILRDSGGVSATEKLLGLDRQPSIVGAFSAPPGNSEALRHMTPTMRRTAMRNLLQKQRERMLRLGTRLQREEDETQGESDDTSDYALNDQSENGASQLGRARRELGHAVLMLSLLEELLIMQDYTVSQMGTFSKG